MKWKNVMTCLAAGFVLLQLFSGCTAIGYGVGYLVDSAGADVASYPPAKAASQLDAGDDIVVVLKDGTSKHGSYDGVIALTENEMLVEAVSSVSDGCVTNAPLWPGDTIRLQFQGSDPVDAIYLNADQERLYYRTLGTRRVVGARYWDIKSITFCDGGVLSADFASQYLNRNFESIFDVRLRDGEKILLYPSPAIDHIKLSEKSFKYRQILAGAGLAIDATAIAILLGGTPADDDTEE